jgi:hypothetical protein
MSTAAAALKPLPAASRRRAIAWLAELFGDGRGDAVAWLDRKPVRIERGAGSGPRPGGEHDSFADLFDRLSPRTEPERVFAALYWIQVIQQRPSATALDITGALAPLGHKVDRVRDVLPALQGARPALVLQVSRGSGKQGRRVVKLSTAGVRAVEVALAAGGFEAAA